MRENQYQQDCRKVKHTQRLHSPAAVLHTPFYHIQQHSEEQYSCSCPMHQPLPQLQQGAEHTSPEINKITTFAQKKFDETLALLQR